MNTNTAAVAAALFSMAVTGAHAQNVTMPSNDWNGNWGFGSTGEKTFRILQADVIEKKEAGYYESLGQYNVTINNDYRQGSFDSISAGNDATIDVSTHIGDEIGQNTNVIGAINNSTTTIDANGTDIDISATNEATTQGCLDGGITVTTLESGSSSQAGALCE